MSVFSVESALFPYLYLDIYGFIVYIHFVSFIILHSGRQNGESKFVHVYCTYVRLVRSIDKNRFGISNRLTRHDVGGNSFHGCTSVCFFLLFVVDKVSARLDRLVHGSDRRSLRHRLQDFSVNGEGCSQKSAQTSENGSPPSCDANAQPFCGGPVFSFPGPPFLYLRFPLVRP